MTPSETRARAIATDIASLWFLECMTSDLSDAEATASLAWRITAALIAAEQRGAPQLQARCEALTTALRDIEAELLPAEQKDWLSTSGKRCMSIIRAALAASGAETTGREPMDFVRALNLADAGYRQWASKPHNKKWVARIDGTPIPNDLLVNIAEQFARLDSLRSETGRGETR